LLVPAWISPLISLYSAYRAGYLWRAGGISEQPRRYVHAMAEIDRKVQELDRERLEDAKKAR
jgi:hypothetical protein